MIWQFIRFSSFGVINTLVGLLSIFGTKAYIYDNDVIANAAGYGTGLLVSFLLNKSWTFHDHSSFLKSGIRFLEAFFICYALNLGTVLTCIYWFDLNSYLAQAIGVIPYTIFFFLICKYYTFNGSK